MRTRVIVSFALVLFGAYRAHCQEILIPLTIDGSVSGGYGSEWITELTVYNGSDEPVIYVPPSCAPFVPARFCIGPQSFLPKRSSKLDHLRKELPGPGVILKILSGPADALEFNLRVAGVSRSQENLGTEIPVVRARDARTGVTSLLAVPTREEFRALLRIYDFDGRPESLFRVRVFDAAAENLVAETEVVTHGYAAFPHLDVISSPGYAEMRIPATPGGEARIEISPMTPGSRFWAFASVTNNLTQMVTLMTPQ
ncbi:MAG: hypothetical protein LC732_11110 [Acidobacteria bacterium]|nr:hypothetical protein [Acidobacteriota bacterium]